MEAPLQPGDTLAGKYRVDRILGMGGMGIVVAAHDLFLDRRVAIKFLLSVGVASPEVLARFQREARAAARIESEHVARVIDVGSLPDGAPYMVMEYLEGSDLAHHIAERGALPIEEAIDYVLQACEALAEAHVLGIVHRDLKPANLFLTRRADGSNFVKVLDFGISKAGGGSGSQPDMTLTKTSAVMGSPMYMAPEQMRSARQVDATADIWALGVILYELLSGKVPFEATSMPELCALVLTEPAPPLRDRCAHAPPALVTVVERCLQKDPAARFANVGEFANALEAIAPQSSRHSAERISRVLRAKGVESRSTAPASEPAVRAGDATSDAWSPVRTASTQRSKISAVLVMALLALGGSGMFVWCRARSSVPAGAAAAIASPAPSIAPAAAAPETPMAPLLPAEAVSSAAPPASAVTSSAPAPPASTANAVPATPRRTGGSPKRDKPDLAAAMAPTVTPEPKVAPVVTVPAPPAPMSPPPPPLPPPQRRNPLDMVPK